jgi:nitronate monooxygenase
MPLRTRLCDLLGIEVALVQAPIGASAGPRLAAAVSNAGALGMLALTWTEVDDAPARVEQTRELTDRPFGVNFVLAFEIEQRLQLALEAGVHVVSLAWGDPAPYVERIHAAGALAVATIGSAEQARAAEASGVDAVVAQGWEAGAHLVGTVSTLTLVPAVADAVNVPVIAAGGIADGRGLAAVLALGADGAWVGTRFVLAEEASVHPLYRERLLAAAETDTYYSELFDANWHDAPHRTLRNSTIERWELAGKPPSGRRPGEGEELGRRADGSPIFRYDAAQPTDSTAGDVEALALWAGQGVGIMRAVEPAHVIVRDLADGAERILRGLAAAGG